MGLLPVQHANHTVHRRSRRVAFDGNTRRLREVVVDLGSETGEHVLPKNSAIPSDANGAVDGR